MSDDEVRIGGAYPLAQLARSSASSGATAPRKAGAWLEILRGMWSGQLTIGSRTPVADTPPWVTLEVVHGGFATGRFAAGGPLDPFEKSRLEELGEPGGSGRLAINESFLDDGHAADLEAWLDGLSYRLVTPEESALLTAAWLARRAENARAVELLVAVRPWFDRLRFYPHPASRPLASNGTVHVDTVGPVRDALADARRHPHVSRMNEAMRIYAPLCDRTVSLWLETVEGEVPDMMRDGEGGLVRAGNGQPIPVGGRPGAVIPSDFAARARAILDDHARARTNHHATTKSERKGELYFELRMALARFVERGERLDDRDAARVRRCLAAFVAAHGAPGSERHRTMREAQAKMADLPLHSDVSREIAARLEPLPADDVLDDLAPVVVGLNVPERVTARLRRCVAGPPELLIRDGRLPSAEALAKVVSPLAASAYAVPIQDPALRALVRSTYLAFRQRRSLLLVNLESQVRFEELPWIRAVQPWLRSDRASQDAARATLERLVFLSLGSFPQTVIPNRLMKEIRSLARGAGLALPLVDEIAADIFMGTFSGTFLEAAKASSARLRSTLYARYYGVPVDALQRIDDVVEGRFGVRTSADFDSLCSQLTGTPPNVRRSPATNGATIEWAQILTTHNLVPLIEALGLTSSLPLEAMAREAFLWCIHRLARPAPRPYIARVRNKNCAYAFRQALCFASLGGEESSARFVAWTREALGDATSTARETLEPAVTGLERAIRGETLGRTSVDAQGRAVRWIGWIATAS